MQCFFANIIICVLIWWTSCSNGVKMCSRPIKYLPVRVRRQGLQLTWFVFWPLGYCRAHLGWRVRKWKDGWWLRSLVACVCITVSLCLHMHVVGMATALPIFFFFFLQSWPWTWFTWLCLSPHIETHQAHLNNSYTISITDLLQHFN